MLGHRGLIPNFPTHTKSSIRPMYGPMSLVDMVRHSRIRVMDRVTLWR